MSTNGMSDWAVDLANVAEVYPFPGTEFMLFIAGLVFWIGWHLLQFRAEATEIDHETAASTAKDKVSEAIDRY